MSWICAIRHGPCRLAATPPCDVGHTLYSASVYALLPRPQRPTSETRAAGPLFFHCYPARYPSSPTASRYLSIVTSFMLRTSWLRASQVLMSLAGLDEMEPRDEIVLEARDSATLMLRTSLLRASQVLARWSRDEVVHEHVAVPHTCTDWLTQYPPPMIPSVPKSVACVPHVA